MPMNFAGQAAVMQLSAECPAFFSQHLAYLAYVYCNMTKKGLWPVADTGNTAFIYLLQKAAKGHRSFYRLDINNVNNVFF